MSGYLTGCVNGTFAPVCGEANIGGNELAFACYISNGVACKLSMCALCSPCMCGNKYTCRKHQFHASWQPLSLIHILFFSSTDGYVGTPPKVSLSPLSVSNDSFFYNWPHL